MAGIERSLSPCLSASTFFEVLILKLNPNKSIS
jgi:hypothetical protein